jgi:predicted short-subunit dehydrogenase-like oxidoreductase (DUF2520 family)
MRELERDLVPTPTTEAPIVIVGRGRVGRTLARELRVGGVAVRLSPSEEATQNGAGATAALLCVPDDAIAEVCEAVAAADPAPTLVGHVSGASTLEPLAAAASVGAATFSMHPLQTFADDRTRLEGVPCAIAGSDPDAEEFASALAERLRMRYFAVPDDRRAAYHAAASIASNFLIALQESAAELLSDAGIEDGRELLAPLVLRTAANWAERGGEALTGPIARGDAATVERHREALTEVSPELLPLYDALAERTEALAATEEVGA